MTNSSESQSGAAAPHAKTLREVRRSWSAAVLRSFSQPKARLFAILSILWFFPSLGAIWILIMNRAVWRDVTSAAEFLSYTRLEQWVALALLLAHGVFVVLALETSRRARAH